MKLTSFEIIVRALNAAEVRFLVVGGLAVNAHGYLRFTNDVDLVIRLTEKDILAAFKALENIGYKPIAPVTAEEFANVACFLASDLASYVTGTSINVDGNMSPVM